MTTIELAKRKEKVHRHRYGHARFRLPSLKKGFRVTRTGRETHLGHPEFQIEYVGGNIESIGCKEPKQHLKPFNRTHQRVSVDTFTW